MISYETVRNAIHEAIDETIAGNVIREDSGINNHIAFPRQSGNTYAIKEYIATREDSYILVVCKSVPRMKHFIRDLEVCFNTTEQDIKPHIITSAGRNVDRHCFGSILPPTAIVFDCSPSSPSVAGFSPPDSLNHIPTLYVGVS